MHQNRFRQVNSSQGEQRMTVRKDTEMEQHDLRSRVVALEQASIAKEQRVTALEEWRRLRDIAEAKMSAEWAIMIEKINEMSGTLKWVNRLIIGGFVAAIMALVWKAGIAP